MRKKYKKVFRVLNYIDHSLIVISTITGCVSISAFAKVLIDSNISHDEFVLIMCSKKVWYERRNQKFQ